MRVVWSLILLSTIPLSAGCSDKAAETGDDTGGAAEGPDIAEVASGKVIPYDACPAPDGGLVYYVGTTSSGESWLYSVADGEDPADVAWLTDAVSVVLSDDGATAYVADRGDDAVYKVDLATKVAEVMAGTYGLHPAALDYFDGSLWFVGGDSDDDSAAIYEVSLSDGSATKVYDDVGGWPGPQVGYSPPSRGRASVVAEDEEEDWFALKVVSRSALTAAQLPTIYVAAQRAAADGEVMMLDASGATTLYDSARLGTPPGISIAPDGSTLMVSSLDDSGKAQVLLLDPASGSAEVFNDVIGENEGAGGLHKAAAADIYAWADVCGSASCSKVYKISY